MKLQPPFSRIADEGLRFLRLALCVGVVIGCGGILGADEHDPRAVEVAERMMTAMGGENAWNDAYLNDRSKMLSTLK
jgi:hypothetical protein